ncbi:hypothetical protein [Mycolicibacterium wolinskyi]|uniref:hypothetical protein n=1 Tax=Mycolicibacterium wolinskyi TaxID=59750 RepID=UPI001041F93C|nr:hypothetical protein [Mycolicibacterium wolinskyi]
MAADDKHNRRDNNDIRLADHQQVHIAAIVLIECFTPSNIKELLANIDTWPIKPPEYLTSLKDQIRKWRNSQYGGAWRHVAMFGRPDSGLFDYVADPSIPKPIRGVEFLLSSPLPSLTTLTAIFYPADEVGDISDELRKYYLPRIDRARFTAKGKVARFSHVLPFSRAKNVYFTVVEAKPEQQQREHVESLFSDLEASCWQWLSKRALGKVGALSVDRRPSLRCILLDDLEPFGPIERGSRGDDIEGFKSWFDSDSDQPYGDPRGPLAALGLDQSTSAWTTEKRDSFYFSTPDRHYGTSRAAYISANRSSLVKALGQEFDTNDSALSIFNNLLRNYTLGLLSAWTVEQMLSRHKEEIADIRDSSAASQSAYRVADKLNDFLVREGHDATIVSRDATRIAALDYSFRETPPFVNLSDIRMRQAVARRANEQSGETQPPNHRWWRRYLKFWESNAEAVPEVESDEAETEPLVVYYRRQIAANARLVASELELTTNSISTSATLLQAMSEIRLQRWSVGIAVVAAVIAVVAIIVSLL